MRPEDLIPTFYAFLNTHAPEVLKAEDQLIYHHLINHRFADHVNWEHYYESEDAVYDLERLFDLMDSIAPETARFGAHPGDGADYGFWETEAPED
jgi:hypothetical protein